MPKEPSKKLIKPTKRNCRYKFNDPELLAIGKELVEHNAELTALELDKKRVMGDFTARITAKESHVSIAANKIQSGYEWRDLPCTIHFHSPKAGKKTTLRDDTGELVATEDMTPEELQQDLPMSEQGEE